MTHGHPYLGLFIVYQMTVLLGLSTLLTAFLGGCIGLRNWGRTVHPILKYASIAVLIAVIVAAGLQIAQLFDLIDHMDGVFIRLVLIPVALVLIPLVVIGLYLQMQSRLTRVNLLSTTALSWGPSFIIGLILAIGVGPGLDLAQTNSQQEILRSLGVVLAGVMVVASGIRLSQWINPLVSPETPS